MKGIDRSAVLSPFVSSIEARRHENTRAFTFVRAIFLAGVAASGTGTAFDSPAQAYPVKPVRILVGFTAGTGVDLIARMVAQKLSQDLGRPVIVENRTGASGSIANERAATSPSDGYTLLVLPSSSAVLPALSSKLTYDLQQDFVPITLLATGTFVLVAHPSVPARNVKELIALARSQPGKLSYGSSGVATLPHLMAEQFNSMAKLKIVHVPYKGSSEFVVANAGGQVDISFSSVTPALPLLAIGKLNAMGVTSAKRTPILPSVPTLDESGLAGYERSSWFGVNAPTGTPKNIIERLNTAITKEFNTPEMKDALNKQGLEPHTSTPEQYASLMRSEIERNIKLIRAIGVKPE